MACVLMDIDGTLLAGPSSERLFIGQLLRHGRLGPGQLLAAAGFFLQWGARYGRDVGRKNKAYLAGLPADEIRRFAAAFVHTELIPRLRPALVQRLAEHRAAGDVILLLSGTPSFIAAPLAEAIAAHGWNACECEERDGVFGAAPPRRHPFGTDKRLMAARLCKRWGFRLADCVAYADTVHDLPLLYAVGRAVAVFPDTGLAAAARRCGWEIIDRNGSAPPWRREAARPAR